ncbi:enoyl-CoA hydratase/isomerase family protein [Thermodesulfobacteriota bacterium]
MTMHLAPKIDCETFSAELVDRVGVLRFKKDFLLRTSDLTARDRMLDYFDLYDKDEKIKAMVIFGAPDSKGRDEYLGFYHKASQQGVDSDFIHRMMNVINQIILKIVELDKIVVYANSGRILPHFLNVSFAADFTIFADNAVIQNPCMEMGLVPKGGGAYFLSKMFGKPKAYDFLLSEKEITAHDALQMGIVNEVVPVGVLEERAMEVAEQFAKMPATSLWGIKKLINYSCKDLSDYLEFENQISLKTCRKSESLRNCGSRSGRAI